MSNVTVKETEKDSFASRAARSGVWLAFFRTLSQSFSWIITILVARLLSPTDYGLMDIATILTGYVFVFSEMGLGSAIIQRRQVSRAELSSIFWLSLMTGIIFALISFFLSYPTAWIFQEPRVIPLTQVSSVLFIVSGLMIVPYNLLMRDARFREIGVMNLVSVIIASLSMLYMARNNFGVWTLINGTILLRSVNCFMALFLSKWTPTWHFLMKDVRPFLKFGINISGSSSLFYIFQKADKFIVGKAFNAQYLGYYSFAMQLTSIPTDKIVSLVQQVVFPIFSNYQDDVARIRELYLRITRYICLITTPMFFGGFFFGEEVVLSILGDKWISIIFLFRMFCIMQFVVSVTELNNIVHNARGRPDRTLLFNLGKTIFVPVSLFFASRFGFNALAWPWLVVFPVLCLIWTAFTLRTIELPVTEYLTVFIKPFIASTVMVIGIKLVTAALKSTVPVTGRVLFAQEIVTGIFIYSLFLVLFQKRELTEAWKLRKKR